MLANAETRERRQKRLEHFFREAYALTFGLRPGEKRRPSHYEDEGEGGQVVTVMRTSLSKSEFASALGMKPDAIFVKKMFNIVDKDGDGRISFQVCKIVLKKNFDSQSFDPIKISFYSFLSLNFQASF